MSNGVGGKESEAIEQYTPWIVILGKLIAMIQIEKSLMAGAKPQLELFCALRPENLETVYNAYQKFYL